MRKNCENSHNLGPMFSGQNSKFRFDLSWIRSENEDLQVKKPNMPKNKAIFGCDEHQKTVLPPPPPPKKNTFLSKNFSLRLFNFSVILRGIKLCKRKTNKN